HSLAKPFLQVAATFAGWQREDAELDLAEDDWINCAGRFVVDKPRDYLLGWLLPGGLAQHVSIDEVPHSVSVLSDGSGWNQSFSGQRFNQSTILIAGVDTFLRRYSPV